MQHDDANAPHCTAVLLIAFTMNGSLNSSCQSAQLRVSPWSQCSSPRPQSTPHTASTGAPELGALLHAAPPLHLAGLLVKCPSYTLPVAGAHCLALGCSGCRSKEWHLLAWPNEVATVNVSVLQGDTNWRSTTRTLDPFSRHAARSRRSCIGRANPAGRNVLTETAVVVEICGALCGIGIVEIGRTSDRDSLAMVM